MSEDDDMPNTVRSLPAALLILLALAARMPAQEKPEAPVDPAEVRRLERLLDELRRIDPAAWEVRLRRLAARIDQHQARSRDLRRRAQELMTQAAEQDALVATLRKAVGEERELARRLGRTEGAVTAEVLARGGLAVPPAMPLWIPRPVAAPAAARNPPSPAPDAKEPVAAAPAMPGAIAREKVAVRLTNFEDHVLPVFEEHCAGCHNPDDASGGLDLSDYRGAMRGGGSGAVIEAKDPEGSRLFRLVSHRERPTMPPDQPAIDAAKIEAIRQWIEDGAHADEAAARGAAMKAGDAEPKAATPPLRSLPEGEVPMPRDGLLTVAAEGARPPVLKGLAASPRAPLVALPGHGEVLLRHGESGALLAVLPFAWGQVEVLRFSLDGARLLAAGGRPGKRGGATLYDVRTGEEVSRFEAGRDTVLAGALSPGQTLVALGGPARKVRVYAAATGEELFEIEDHKEWILSLDVSADGNWLASADRGGRVSVWEADTGRNVHHLKGHKGAVHAVRFRPDAKVLASGGDDGTVRLWDVARGRQTRQIPAHEGKVLALDWSREHGLATVGSDRRLKLWKADGKALATLPPLEDWGYSVGWSRGGDAVWVGTWKGRVQLFDPAKKVELPFGEVQ